MFQEIIQSTTVVQINDFSTIQPTPIQTSYKISIVANSCRKTSINSKVIQELKKIHRDLAVVHFGSV